MNTQKRRKLFYNLKDLSLKFKRIVIFDIVPIKITRSSNPFLISIEKSQYLLTDDEPEFKTSKVGKFMENKHEDIDKLKVNI